jgi:hypothetical protein
MVDGSTTSLLEDLLAFAWAPLLVAEGVMDWALHPAQRIEFTAGLKESLLHLAMLGLVGSAILAALLLEMAAGLLVLLILIVLLHDLSYLADLRVALARRKIPMAEQWVRGFHASAALGRAGLPDGAGAGAGAGAAAGVRICGGLGPPAQAAAAGGL